MNTKHLIFLLCISTSLAAMDRPSVFSNLVAAFIETVFTREDPKIQCFNAVLHGRIDEIRNFITSGAIGVNDPISAGKNLLEIAIQYKPHDKQLMDYLLSIDGIQVSATSCGITPAISAACCNYLEVAKKIWNHSSCDKQREHEALSKVLFEKSLYLWELQNVFSFMKAQAIDLINVLNSNYQVTLLMRAVKSDDQDKKKIVRFLLEQGADPLVANSQGKTAFDYADTIEIQQLMAASIAPKYLRMRELGLRADANTRKTKKKPAIVH